MTKRFQSFQFVTSHAPFLGNRIQSFYRRVPSQFRSSFSSFPSQLLSFALFDPYSSFFDRTLLPVGVNQTQGSSNDQHLLAYQQCEKIGLFLKVLDNKISSKKSPNDWQLFRLFLKNLTIVYKLLCLLFGQLLEKFGLLFLQHLFTLPLCHRLAKFVEWSHSATEVSMYNICSLT